MKYLLELAKLQIYAPDTTITSSLPTPKQTPACKRGSCIYNFVHLPPKVEIETYPNGSSLCEEGSSLLDTKCAVYKWQCPMEESKACKTYGKKNNYAMAGCFPGKSDTFYYLPNNTYKDITGISGPPKQKGKDCNCLGPDCTCDCTCILFPKKSSGDLTSSAPWAPRRTLKNDGFKIYIF